MTLQAGQELSDTAREAAGSGGACLRCGACCRWAGHVLLTGDDIRRLARWLGLEERTFIERHTRLASNRAQLTLTDQPSGSCIFLQGNECGVHPARPAQCRSFPQGWSVPGCPVESL